MYVQGYSSHTSKNLNTEVMYINRKWLKSVTVMIPNLESCGQSKENIGVCC